MTIINFPFSFLKNKKKNRYCLFFKKIVYAFFSGIEIVQVCDWIFYAIHPKQEAASTNLVVPSAENFQA
jgi:hypothetical protein